MTNSTSDKRGQKRSQNVKIFHRFIKFSLDFQNTPWSWPLRFTTLKTAKHQPFEADSDWPYLNYNFCMSETALLHDSLYLKFVFLPMSGPTETFFFPSKTFSKLFLKWSKNSCDWGKTWQAGLRKQSEATFYPLPAHQARISQDTKGQKTWKKDFETSPILMPISEKTKNSCSTFLGLKPHVRPKS